MSSSIKLLCSESLPLPRRWTRRYNLDYQFESVNNFSFNSWIRVTRRSHAKKRTKESCGKRMKLLNTKLLLFQFFSTMLFSWPLSSLALFTSLNLLPLLLTMLELCLWPLESLLSCPLVLNNQHLIKILKTPACYLNLIFSSRVRYPKREPAKQVESLLS